MTSSIYIFTAFNFYCYCCQYYHFAFNNNVNSEIIKKSFTVKYQNDRISGLIQLRLQNDTQVYAHFESDLFP